MAPNILSKGLLPNSIELIIRKDFSLNIPSLKDIFYLAFIYPVIHKIEKWLAANKKWITDVSSHTVNFPAFS